MYNKIISIVGGGPNSVYATDILIKKILKKKIKRKIKIIYFDKNGLFGYGNTHNKNLPNNILLNRIAHQISLGAYPFIKFPKKFKDEDYNFMEWIKKNKIENIQKESWPPRALFGKALEEKFLKLLKIIALQNNIDFQLIYDEVVNVKKIRNKYIIETKNTKINCTNILFCTGNYHTSKKNSKLSRYLNSLTQNTNCNYHYDFLNLLPDSNFWKNIFNQNIIVYGTGVTSIDIISLLKNRNNKIYSISKSSLFPFARPFNQKLSNPQLLEHKPIFLDDKTIIYLKEEINNKKNFNKISFEKFIHPFIKIEMYYLYFSHFFNIKKLEILKNKIIKKFLFIKKMKENDFSELENLFSDYLLNNLEEIDNKFYKNEWFGQKKIIYAIKKKQYSFYDVMINPLIFSNQKNFRRNYIKFLIWDIKEAKKGNLKSPFKNTCDGLWRDIRQQYTKLFDNCENLKIFNYFIKNILSIHNKLCDGPSVDSIEKIKKLILKKQILLVRNNNHKLKKIKNNVYLNFNKNIKKIDTIFYGILDLYKNTYLKDKLILSMLNNKILQLNSKKIKNKTHTLGLNLTKYQNPIKNNKIEKNITFIGPASEGKKFFHHTLSRPDKLQPNIMDLIDWSNRII